MEDTIQSHNLEIFEKIGYLGNISEAQCINKMREHFNKLEKIAVKSVQSTKYAICSIIEVTNRLGSISVSSSNTNIQVSAIDKTLRRHQKHSLQNSSALKYLKRKINTSNNNKTVTEFPLKKKNCRLCRDHFKEPPEIYSTHCANSSKCPHFTTVDRKSAHELKSGDNILIDNNYKELFVPDSKCTQVADDTDKINIPITSNKSDTNEDSLDDDGSAYTMADSFDPDKQTFSEKSKEPICPGDVIHYYCPIFVSGDPRGLRETSVLLLIQMINFLLF